MIDVTPRRQKIGGNTDGADLGFRAIVRPSPQRVHELEVICSLVGFASSIQL